MSSGVALLRFVGIVVVVVVVFVFVTIDSVAVGDALVIDDDVFKFLIKCYYSFGAKARKPKAIAASD